MAEKKFSGIKFFRNLISFFFMAVVGYLLLSSIYSTCYIGAIEYMTGVDATEINAEHTFFIRDFFLPHLLIFVLFSFVLLYKKRNLPAKWTDKKVTGILVCALAAMLYIILAGRHYPKYDQRTVIELAAAFRNGDHTSLNEGGYLFKYPHQLGIVLYFQLLSVIFGDLNYIAFEIVNAVFILFTYILLAKIGGILWEEEERRTEGGIMLVCVLFLPYLFYAAYLYGTVIGLFFALLSFYMLLLYEKNPRISCLLAGSVGMGIAVVLKSNYLIFLIGAVFFLFFRSIAAFREERKKALRYMLFLLALLVCFWLGRMGTEHYLNRYSGGNGIKGLPMVTYIAMGLQDGKAAPGWYNGYNNTVFEENGYDQELTAKAAKAEIVRIVSKYPGDMTSSISFFVKKIVSQWNNPTFQSIWLLEEREGTDGLLWLMEGRGRAVYIFLVNLFQTWMLTGVFLYAVLRFRKETDKETLLKLTFLGGFAFHIFWEAKAMYTIPFYLLLIPFCVCGYMAWKERLTEQKERLIAGGRHSPAANRVKKEIAIGAVVLIMITGLSYTEAFAKLFARNEDTGIFNTYTQEIVNQDEAWQDMDGNP